MAPSDPISAKKAPMRPVPQRRPWALESLPPFPSVALRLLSLLDDIEVPMRRIVALLNLDPALSGEVLRVSNSALYGISRRVDSIPHAIVVLGAEAVKRLAITVALRRFSHTFLRYQGLRICWDHSVACALLSAELADWVQQPRERAYIAGLLHDLGRLALLAAYPREYDNLLAVAREQGFDELEAERELFDIDHCAAGEWLGREWNLPGDFVEAISSHHGSFPREASLPAIVAGGHRLANVLGYAVVGPAEDLSVESVLDRLPLPDPAAAAARFRNFGEQIEGVASTLLPPGEDLPTTSP